MGTRNVHRCKCGIFLVQMPYLTYARLAQSAERKALNLVVMGSSPTVGVLPPNLHECQLHQTI